MKVVEKEDDKVVKGDGRSHNNPRIIDYVTTRVNSTKQQLENEKSIKLKHNLESETITIKEEKMFAARLHPMLLGRSQANESGKKDFQRSLRTSTETEINIPGLWGRQKSGWGEEIELRNLTFFTTHTREEICQTINQLSDEWKEWRNWNSWKYPESQSERISICPPIPTENQSGKKWASEKFHVETAQKTFEWKIL